MIKFAVFGRLESFKNDSASSSSTNRMIARRKGRAPYVGLKPSSTTWKVEQRVGVQQISERLTNQREKTNKYHLAEKAFCLNLGVIRKWMPVPKNWTRDAASAVTAVVQISLK